MGSPPHPRPRGAARGCSTLVWLRAPTTGVPRAPTRCRRAWSPQPGCRLAGELWAGPGVGVGGWDGGMLGAVSRGAEEEEAAHCRSCARQPLRSRRARCSASVLATLCVCTQ